MLDGELIIPVGDALSFDALQLRLHPAESRVRKLAAETPAELMLFDCSSSTASLFRRAAGERREALESILPREYRARTRSFHRYRDREARRRWLSAAAARSTASSPSALDHAYGSGERAMLKVKQLRTADCVVGGFRYAERSRRSARCCSASTTMQGLLDHVGFTSAIPARTAGADHELEKLIEPPGFTGNAPGGPSRWNTERTEPVAAAEARAGRRGALRPGHRRPLPPRHRLPALAARQGPQAVHLRPARARASAVGAQGVVRRMSLCSRRR